MGIKKVVGRDVRRRPAKPGGRELADLGLWEPVWKEWWREMLAGWRRNVLAAGKRWALGRQPAKTETKMPPAGKCAPRICAPEKFALAFLFAG